MSRVLIGTFITLLGAGFWLRSPALLVLVLLAAPAEGLWTFLSRRRERRRRLTVLLEGGVAGFGKPAWWAFGTPDRARWGSGELELSWLPGPKGKPGETEARLAAAGPVKGFVAVSTHDVRRMAGLLGGPAVKLSDPAFDPAFYVRSAPPNLAAEALSAECRRALLELKALLSPAGFEVTFGGRELAFYAADELLDDRRLSQVLERLVRAAKSLGTA